MPCGQQTVKPAYSCLTIKNQIHYRIAALRSQLAAARFLRKSDAVNTTYVLIAIVKKELHLDASLYTLLQILSVSVFEKTLISCALQLDVTRTVLPYTDNQLTLFDI